jgi:predicted nucleic acid-binding protein
MKLDQVVSGRVYVDVNIFYMYVRPDPEHLSSLRAFWDRVVRGDVKAFTSVLTMDELFYRLLLARIKDTHKLNPLDVLRDRGQDAVRSCGPEIATALRKLIQLPNLALTTVNEDDMLGMLEITGDVGVLPRDALHLAVMRRLGLSEVATDDTDFDQVPWLRRHWVFNKPHNQADQHG